ncbi:glycosyltransferase family 4 protein [Thiocapsa rosea]|nr:glycosyltransferase family 4 protein [Thiocapsa rosea]
MAYLAEALAQRGFNVVYVTEIALAEDRERQGWPMLEPRDVRLVVAPTKPQIRDLIEGAAAGSVHLCQGLMRNGMVAYAQSRLAKRGLQQWVLMETVKDSGISGLLRRLAYQYSFFVKKSGIQGVLAIGHRTPDWVGDRGIATARIVPFAYFLKDVCLDISGVRVGARYNFVFVGQFVKRKRLSLLLDALSELRDYDFGLKVIGAGPLEMELRRMGLKMLGDRVEWIGVVPMDDVLNHVARADCLVLPSAHDGWGAVVSEALMVGTPAVCSDACGCAAVVTSSGYGGVFGTDDYRGLVCLLRTVISRGRLIDEERHALAAWARCLGATRGGEYLQEILAASNTEHSRPTPPWAID